MPDNFAESPYFDHPTITGAAMLTGHARYAEWFRETDHPNYVGRVASYKATTERLNGIGAGSDAAPPGKPPVGSHAGVSRSWAGGRLRGAPRPPDAPVGLLGAARTFAVAVGRQLRAVATGERRKATPGTVAARLAVCDPCEFNAKGRCSKCSCKLKGIVSKTAWATESCPIGRWGVEH